MTNLIVSISDADKQAAYDLIAIILAKAGIYFDISEEAGKN